MSTSLRQHPLLKPVKRVYHWIQSRLATHFGAEWRGRIRDALAAPDNAFIPRVPDAGKIIDGCQIMHNGLRIHRGSYYGYPIKRMLKLNKGVHEPQEERAFAEVLKHMPPGAVMLELGAYWGFYSMWFQREVRQAKNFLVEPEAENLEFGRRNFQLNGFTGDFTQSLVGADSSPINGRTQICVDDFMRSHSIARLNILHCDIQGFEVDMLWGAQQAFAEKRVDYAFISTHSSDLHENCQAVLRQHGYLILAECDLPETYSYDGLIVARSPAVGGPDVIEISKKP